MLIIDDKCICIQSICIQYISTVTICHPWAICVRGGGGEIQGQSSI